MTDRISGKRAKRLMRVAKFGGNARSIIGTPEIG
jgi:hypothetical protein